MLEAWQERFGLEAPVVYVGAYGGYEEKLVPRGRLQGFFLLRLGSLRAVSRARKFKTLLQLPWTLLRAVIILMRFRPTHVVGVGGYAAGPTVIVAVILRRLWLLRCRTAILEQNAIPGFTNRILGRFVEQVFGAFAGTRFLQREVIVTGHPVRAVFEKQRFDWSTNPHLLIVGGSQGAWGINRLVVEALPYLQDLKIHHQTGQRDLAWVREAYAQYRSAQVTVEAFIQDMPQAYRQASLVVCRSGASTLAELSAVGRGALMIPLPSAAEDHQSANARVFASAGAAQLLPQKELNGERLAQIISELMGSPMQLRAMGECARGLYVPRAASLLVEQLIGP